MDETTQKLQNQKERPEDATNTASLPSKVTCLDCVYSSTEFDYVFCLYFEREVYLPDAMLCSEFDFALRN